MEKKLDLKFLGIVFAVNMVALVVMIAVCALVGAKMETPQSVVFPASIVSVITAGAVSGFVCARYAPQSPMVYALITAALVTSLICLTSLGGDGGSLIKFAIPLLAFVTPPLVAHLSMPKSTSKRKLKHLGVKI